MKYKDLVDGRTLTIVIAGIIAVVLLGIMVFSPKGSTSGTKGREGYVQITDVPGVTFEVDQNLTNYATAVLEVSKSVDFVKNASYSYRNGSDTYMLFNMSQYIIVAKKGTTFDFENTKVGDSLELNSLNGIWFSNPSNIEKNGNSCSLDVEAQVVITNTIYNDFTGRLSTIKNNDEEWSLFVGLTNPDDAAMQGTLKNVISSFMLAEVNSAEEKIYEIDVETEETAPFVEVEVKDIEKPEEIIPSVSEEAGEGASSSEDVVSEETPEAPAEEVPAEEIKVETENILTASYNQKAPDYNDTKAYTSSLYSMLNKGQTGYFSAIDQAMGVLTEGFVRLDKVNNESDTQEIIDKYIKSGEAYYSEMEASMGTHFESIEFSVKTDVIDELYVNTELIGFDGEAIRYRGITYSKKTYDILAFTKDKNGFRTGYIAFYEVPNGCTEYAISFGDTYGEMGYKAYYKVR